MSLGEQGGGPGGAAELPQGRLVLQKRNLTVSRNPRKASHPQCCASLTYRCFQTLHPAQERFTVSACFLSHCQLIAEVFECWLFSPSRRNRGRVLLSFLSSPCWIFPSLIISVFKLSKHQPCMSLAPPAAGQSTPALTGAAKGDQLENHSPDQAALLQGQGSPVHIRLWLWGGCIPSGHVWRAQDGLVQTLDHSRRP